MGAEPVERGAKAGAAIRSRERVVTGGRAIRDDARCELAPCFHGNMLKPALILSVSPHGWRACPAAARKTHRRTARTAPESAAAIQQAQANSRRTGKSTSEHEPNTVSVCLTAPNRNHQLLRFHRIANRSTQFSDHAWTIHEQRCAVNSLNYVFRTFAATAAPFFQDSDSAFRVFAAVTRSAKIFSKSEAKEVT